MGEWLLIAELKGLHSRETEHIKAWMTKQHEDWTPKYREFNTTYPRRLVLIGTTNLEEFLADETGNRRWLPVKVKGVIDVDRIAKDCPQLWAEGREIFNVVGVAYKEAEALAIEIHDEFRISDVWEAKVDGWLQYNDVNHVATPAFDRNFVTILEVLEGALHMEAKYCTPKHKERVGKILRALGYYPHKGRRPGTKPFRGFRLVVPTDLPCHGDTENG